MDVPGCRRLASAELLLYVLLHALLVVLHAPLHHAVTARGFSIIQRKAMVAEPYPNWPVEGVASVEIANGSGTQTSYIIDCYRVGGSHNLRWERVDSGTIKTQPIEAGVRLDIDDYRILDTLGQYECIDEDDGAREFLLVTDQNPALIPEQSYVEAFINESITLTLYVATIDGHLNLIEWLDPNEAIVMEHHVPDGEGFQATTSRLELSNVSLADAGIYVINAARCIAGQDYERYTTIELSVFALAVITSPPLANITIDEREDVQLVCVATGSSLEPHPLVVTWSRVDDSLPANSEVLTSKMEREEEGTVTVTSKLVLSNIHYTDGGVYHCQASVSLTQKNSTDTASTVVSVIPVLVSFLTTEILALENCTVHLEAPIHTFSDVISVLWYQNQVLLEPESDRRYSSQFNNSMATLTIFNFGGDQAGQYEVVVNTSDGTSGNAAVDVTFPEPPTVSVSPSQLIVEEGERVEVPCVAGGHAPLVVSWLLGDGSELPHGVVDMETKLTIATATLNHSNSYTCSVSNEFYTKQATFDLRVFPPLVAEIVYGNDISTSHVVSFRHGDRNIPSFTCTVSGSFNASITWQVSGGDPLPSRTVVVDGRTLTWTHTLEYSDSGVYECVVTDETLGREKIARVEMTVYHDPVIDTIFPSHGITKGNTAIDFNIPLQLMGTALTCSAFAWPPPSIQWTRNSGALSEGMEMHTRTEGGIVTSDLVFETQFSAKNVGMYKCEVQTEEGEVVSQLVELHEGPATRPSAPDCPSISTDTLWFQLRVATSNCPLWTSALKSEIATNFQHLLYRVISTQCDQDCSVSRATLSVVSQSCSELIDGGVVFRGALETDSAAETEKIFCILFQWQSSGALVSIDGNQFAVDSQCSPRIDSYEMEECAEDPTESSVDMRMVLVIALPLGGVCFVTLVIIVILCCSLGFCRCCKREKKVSDGAGEMVPHQTNLLSFTRTHSDSQPPHPNQSSHTHSISSMSRQEDNPYYDEMGEFEERYRAPPSLSPVYDEATPPNRPSPLTPQSPPPNLAPREHETGFSDLGVSLDMTTIPPPGGSASPPRGPRETNVVTAVQPYQIPTSSTGSLNKVGFVNPMCGLDEPPSRGARRFSDRPLGRSSPTRRCTISCIGQQGSDIDGHATSSSTDDYSKLNHSLPHMGGNIRRPPERKWYMGCDESYAILYQRGGSQTITPYAAVRNSQIATSPLKKSVPNLPLPRGHSNPPHLNTNNRVPPPGVSDSVPSLPHTQQHQQVEAFLV